jgi:outer membrane protein OmpA-like peptidoglycan-associated protein
MRSTLSSILLALPLALAACSHPHAKAANVVPAPPEFAAADGPTVVASTEMAASPSKQPILPDDQIFFANDSTDLGADGKKLLDEVATWVMAAPDRHVVLEGHADTTGARDYNLDLSNRRSLVAKAYLRSRAVPEDRIVIVALGEMNAHLAPGGVNRRILIYATGNLAATELK